MLIWRTLDLAPSLISNTRSTRFWSSWMILGSTDAAKRPERRYSSRMRATSARALERVKIWRGATRISSRILSSLTRFEPSMTIRLMTGFSLTSTISVPASSRMVTSANSSLA